MSNDYYAISGIGYGKGSTPAEALRMHQEYSASAKPSFLKEADWLQRLTEIEVNVFKAPEGATGFTFSGSTVYWTKADGKLLRKATEEDFVS